MHKYDTNNATPLPAGALFHPAPLTKRVTLMAGVLFLPAPLPQDFLVIYSALLWKEQPALEQTILATRQIMIGDIMFFS